MAKFFSIKFNFFIAVCVLLLFNFKIYAQQDSTKYNLSNSDKSKAIDVSDFFDSAHHWYDITDHDQAFFPEENQKRYSPNQIKEIADNILLYQQKNGGWPKNYDMLAVLTEKQKQILKEGSDSLHTTFDNGATYSQIEYLAKAYSKTKIEKYKKGASAGINFILTAQFPNGGWPQFYPDTSGYRKYITFNDGAMAGILKILYEIVDGKSFFSFVDSTTRGKVKISFWKGINCVLKCQIWESIPSGKENEKLTIWCQQHHNVNLLPQNARTFELAAKASKESAEIVQLLMEIDNPNQQIINSIKSAVEWFENSKIKGIKIKRISAPEKTYKYHKTKSDVIIVNDENAAPVWARFYELKSNKPLFANRDGKPVYKLSDVERERRTGYAWYVYDPQKVLDEYPLWLKKIN